MERLKGDFQRGDFDISTLEFRYMLKNTFRCEAYEIREGELQGKTNSNKLLADVGLVFDGDPPTELTRSVTLMTPLCGISYKLTYLLHGAESFLRS